MQTIENMAACGVRSVMYAGEGEPLLHPKLARVARRAKEVGIDNALTTNGVALIPRFIEEGLGAFSWVKVSMNGGQKTYKQVHRAREGDFERVWENLRRAVAFKKKHGLKTVIGIQAIHLPENTGDLEGLVLLARAEGLNYMVIKPYSQHLRSDTKTYKDIHYAAKERAALESLARYNTADFEVVVRTRAMEAHEETTRAYTKCYSTPYFWAYIMATGDVYGCSAYLLDERFRYGNINTESFRDIWLGERRRESMRYVAEDLCIQECRKNCRMDKVNRYLWDLKHPPEHVNFI